MNQYMLSVMKGRRSSFTAHLITYLLVPWSWVYRLGVFGHRTLYRLRRPYKAVKPVLSIGNITVGGSGKTPLVIWLARHLQDKGFKSVILIRGYMPKHSKDSDEVDMLNEQIPYIPVMMGKDRANNIRHVMEILPVDVFICDDAFQHWRLKRDLDIVALDAANPFGNGHLLPAGILREPLSALRRADVVVLTKTDTVEDTRSLCARILKINPGVLIIESCHKTQNTQDVFGTASMPADFLKDQRVAGFCAIGDPSSFESGLRNTGADVVKMFTYMDHHIYTAQDIRRMKEFCSLQKVEVLVTTHKDAVKLRGFEDVFAGVRLIYIPIQLEITKGSDEFLQKVMSVCRG